MNKIKVLVVDDSALVRGILSEIINRQSDMQCVGAASDPLVARELIRALDPDVLTLDVEMPRMDGLEFLARLMRLRPMPVLMVSTLTEQGAATTLRALELGAVDFVAKPRIGIGNGLAELAADIVDKIRIAARARVRRYPGAASATPAPNGPRSALPLLSSEKIVCIGASTGGTEAIREVLAPLPADAPALVLIQHMPAGFTASFAARLDGLCRISVHEAQHGQRILRGHAYIAPGGRHLRIERCGSSYVTVLDDGAPVNRHRPSVEVLFRSAARVLGPNALGIMLTGMGGDGAQAMREMKDAGSYNYVQDEASCVVFGMPRVAIECGAAHEVLPLLRIAPALLSRLAMDAGALRDRI
ncbi:chemotaxis response regulator protein-glutamate methylesterase [Hydrogenophaga sp.]|uniref:protein-glutamate methylesterase/protein-glutamine glutaminase n=1 Tax=Hydrogenophaga sp. TaxID=1904254 RepID=UPI0025BE38F4|nr:chemotaxis response regulator protein-glutamate methylesterase [Hydrogenophaga sp.]